MEANCPLIFELVCYHLEILDVVHLFQTCQSLRLLSKKSNLWSFLFRRDYPEHDLPADCVEDRSWYQELYQFGAYFVIDNKISLWPNSVLYMTSIKGHDTFICTVRYFTNEGIKFIRYPGQTYVLLTGKPKPNKQIRKEILDDPRMTTRFDFNCVESYFIRTVLPQRNVPLVRMEKFDASRFGPLIAWCHEHFNVNVIWYQSDTIYCVGILKTAHYLGVSGTTDNFDHISKRLWNIIYGYQVRIVGKNRVSWLYAPGEQPVDMMDGKTIPEF